MKMNWEIKKLGDVCEFYNGKAHEKSIDEDGKYKVVNSKFVSSNGEKAKRTDDAKFPLLKDDIVMVMSDVPNGKTLAKCFLIDKEDTYTLNQRVCAIRTTNFDKQFLYYQLNRNKYLLGFNNGENQTNLRKDDILNCELLIPPLQEQQQIVAILDKTFAAIDKAKAKAEQNLKNAKELFESYLQNVFDPSTRSGQEGEGWEEKKLGEVCKIIGGGTPSKKKEEYYIGDILWATVRDMKAHIIETTEHKINLEGVKNSSTNIIPKGNVIIATRVGLGKVCLLKYDTAINQDLKGIIPKSLNQLSIDFLYRWFSSISKKIINEGTGATVQGVKLTFINSLKIPLPTLKEQQGIVKKLNDISAKTKKLEVIYQQKIDDLEELKKSVLQKAFNGELKIEKEIVL